MVEELKRDLASVLNRHNIDNQLNTPDFILADYIVRCLESFEEANKERNRWNGEKESHVQDL